MENRILDVVGIPDLSKRIPIDPDVNMSEFTRVGKEQGFSNDELQVEVLRKELMTNTELVGNIATRK